MDQEQDRTAAGPDDGGQLASPAADDSPQAAIERLESELLAERARADTYLNDLKRVQADFINYKRRTEAEQADRARFASSNVILRVLPVLDDLERAIESAGNEPAAQRWTEGVNLVVRKLRNLLESEGITRIDALGADFDPHEHEAVLYEDGAANQDNKVIGVLQAGYKLHDRVIRPAMVKVARGPSASAMPE